MFANQFPQWIARHGGLIPRSFIDDPEARALFNDQVEPAAWKITKRWCINSPFDPALSCDPSQFASGISPPSFDKPQRVEDGCENKPELFQPTVLDCSTPSISVRQTPMELRFVKFQIDIAQPLDSIFAELEVQIEIAKSWYRFHIGELPDFRKRPRVRLQEYDSYLKVWDLRQQGLTFEEIAFRLFPREMKILNSRSAITKRVRSHFQRAKQLIEGEYRQIEG